MLLSLYELVWLLYDTLSNLASHTGLLPTEASSFSRSLGIEFKKNPQAFLIGGITF